MTIHVDTSVLIDALTGPRRSLETLIDLADQGHRLIISSIVLYEWWRGPRTKAELEAQEALFPSDVAVGFGPAEAARASVLYRKVRKPRDREIDLAIAAIALVQGASVLTLNPDDFRDIPGLTLI